MYQQRLEQYNFKRKKTYFHKCAIEQGNIFTKKLKFDQNNQRNEMNIKKRIRLLKTVIKTKNFNYENNNMKNFSFECKILVEKVFLLIELNESWENRLKLKQ